MREARSDDDHGSGKSIRRGPVVWMAGFDKRPVDPAAPTSSARPAAEPASTVVMLKRLGVTGPRSVIGWAEHNGNLRHPVVGGQAQSACLAVQSDRWESVDRPDMIGYRVTERRTQQHLVSHPGRTDQRAGRSPHLRLAVTAAPETAGTRSRRAAHAS